MPLSSGLAAVVAWDHSLSPAIRSISAAPLARVPSSPQNPAPIMNLVHAMLRTVCSNRFATMAETTAVAGRPGRELKARHRAWKRPEPAARPPPKRYWEVVTRSQ